MKITISFRNKEIEKMNTIIRRLDKKTGDYGIPTAKFDRAARFTKQYKAGSICKDSDNAITVNLTNKFTNHCFLLFEDFISIVWKYINSSFVKRLLKTDEFFQEIKEDDAFNNKDSKEKGFGPEGYDFPWTTQTYDEEIERKAREMAERTKKEAENSTSEELDKQPQE